MTFNLAMPSRRRGQKLAYSFDEDELTLAWDALRAAALPAGTKVQARGFAPPAWFWRGVHLTPATDAALVLEPVATTVGPGVLLRNADTTVDVETEARRRHAAARERPEPEWQKHRLAREGPDGEGDYPLGAYVVAARHEDVTAMRMQSSPGTVRSFTTIGPGAAPTEFARLQDAVGAYHVVLVECAGHHTVGIWAADAPPQIGDAASPVLRRLFRTQGTWRHGVKFAPGAASEKAKSP